MAPCTSCDTWAAGVTPANVIKKLTAQFKISGQTQLLDHLPRTQQIRDRAKRLGKQLKTEWELSSVTDAQEFRQRHMLPQSAEEQEIIGMDSMVALPGACEGFGLG
jgi:hypothetical protein